MNKAFPAVAAFDLFLLWQAAAWGQSAPRAAGSQQGAQNKAAITNSDTALQSFVQNYYDAVTHHDKAKLRALVYPQSLTCVDSGSSIYFDQELSLFPENVKTSEPSVKRLDVGEAEAMASAIGAKLPENADLFITIDWKETAGRETTNHPSTMALKKAGNRYLEMLPCPSAADVQSRNAFFQRHKQRP